MNLIFWQTLYYLAGAAILPIAPLLYLQGQRTRRKVGVLPGAAGPSWGVTAAGEQAASLLVIGESTVAGLGASTHEKALAGQFALQLGRELGRPIRWNVIGQNGVTAARTMIELVPKIPDGPYDYVLIGLGGNDVLKLSSPRKWRRDMTDLLGLMRTRYPDAIIFLSNCPMIKYSPALPQPIKFILWELSKLHDRNIRDLTRRMERVFYFHQPHELDMDGFFADGIHPSEKGYADWSEAMVKFFRSNYRW